MLPLLYLFESFPNHSVFPCPRPILFCPCFPGLCMLVFGLGGGMVTPGSGEAQGSNWDRLRTRLAPYLLFSPFLPLHCLYCVWALMLQNWPMWKRGDTDPFHPLCSCWVGVGGSQAGDPEPRWLSKAISVPPWSISIDHYLRGGRTAGPDL